MCRICIGLTHWLLLPTPRARSDADVSVSQQAVRAEGWPPKELVGLEQSWVKRYCATRPNRPGWIGCFQNAETGSWLSLDGKHDLQSCNDGCPGSLFFRKVGVHGCRCGGAAGFGHATRVSDSDCGEPCALQNGEVIGRCGAPSGAGETVAAIYSTSFADVAVLRQTVHPAGFQWFDEYSKGNGMCAVSLGLAAKQKSLKAGELELGNCLSPVNLTEEVLRAVNPQGQHPPLAQGRNVPWLYCPVGLPIASLLIHKCGSTSFVNWLMRIGGVTPALRRIAKSALGGQATLAKDGFGAMVASSGGHCRGNAGDAAAREAAQQALLLQEHMNAGYIMLPPPMCPTCCASGKGRLRTILVRNPFARLVSYFQAYLMGHRRYKLDFFASWIDQLHEIKVRRRTYTFEFVTPYKVSPDVSPYDVVHIRSAWDTLSDMRLSWARHSREPFLVIHLETLSSDMVLLGKELCSSFGHCTPLPPMTQGNQKRKTNSTEMVGGAPQLWKTLWGPREIHMALEMYAWDFATLGYSQSPWELEPVPTANGAPRYVYPPW